MLETTAIELGKVPARLERKSKTGNVFNLDDTEDDKRHGGMKESEQTGNEPGMEG